MKKILHLLKDNKAFNALLNKQNIVVNSSNSEALLIASAFLTLKKDMLIVKSNQYEANLLYKQVSQMIDEALYFPVDESYRIESLAASGELLGQRLGTMYQLTRPGPHLLISHGHSVMRYVPTVDVFKKNILFDQNESHFDTVYSFEKNRKDLLEIIEKQDITQAKLNMGYRIPSNYKSSQHYAFVVFNAIFGGMSQSKLFKVVREKNSLCYYISSSYDAFNGLMIITAGIESKDYQQTIQLIKEQLKEMQDGCFDQDDIDTAKLMIKNSMKKTNDEPLSQVAVQYNRDITGKKETNEQYLEKIENVTYQDIVDVCQNIELDTIFLLKGRNE